jgi:hypothetical protein
VSCGSLKIRHLSYFEPSQRGGTQGLSTFSVSDVYLSRESWRAVLTIITDVITNRPTQVTFTQDDHIVQQFLTLKVNHEVLHH